MPIESAQTGADDRRGGFRGEMDRRGCLPVRPDVRQLSQMVGGHPHVGGERTTEGAYRPFPDSSWNAWDPSGSVGSRFVCVQSVFVDRNDMLWILDSGKSIFHGKVIPGGARLVKVDLASNRVVQVVSSPIPLAAPSASYLNDVRVDEKRGWATSPIRGSAPWWPWIWVSATSRRLLADHPSTKSEGVMLTIDGTPWLTAGRPGARCPFRRDRPGFEGPNTCTTRP